MAHLRRDRLRSWYGRVWDDGGTELAHLAELHGTRVELNSTGGLFGLVHAHLLTCISNTTYYEYFGGGYERAGKEIGMANDVGARGWHGTAPFGSWLGSR